MRYYLEDTYNFSQRHIAKYSPFFYFSGGKYGQTDRSSHLYWMLSTTVRK